MTTSSSANSASSRLGLWDAISLIVGIVVGSSIFTAPSLIFSSLNCVWASLGMWALGGVLSLIGAFCYAELATAYPRSGGDYIYLTRAYGRFAGFLFGWSHLAGILTGSIGALAFVFANHAVQFFAVTTSTGLTFAIASVVLLSILNVFGVALGKRTQNFLTVLKMVGLLGVIFVGIFWGTTHGIDFAPREVPDTFEMNFGFAMILILYAFGGWNDASFVAAEVENPERNLPRALIGGVVAITAIYLLVNLGYVMGLGLSSVSETSTPASAVFGKAFGTWGERAMLVLVMVSALGGVNGLILTGSRVHASLGADHSLFAWLGRWDPRWNTPVASLMTQAVVSTGLMLLLGTVAGQSIIDRMNGWITDTPIAWGKFGGGFGLLVATTAPVFWSFFLLTGSAVITLRLRDGDTPRPFHLPLFPLIPLVFCAMCVFMLDRSIRFAGTLAIVPLVPMAVGVVLYGFQRNPTHPANAEETPA